MHRTRLLPVAALALLLPMVLTGCSNPVDVLQKRVSGTADDRAALLDAWSTPASDPAWVPADATDVRYVAGTAGEADATPGTVRVTSASALPASCTKVERMSLGLLRRGLGRPGEGPARDRAAVRQLDRRARGGRLVRLDPAVAEGGGAALTARRTPSADATMAA